MSAKGIEEPLTPFRALAVDADAELSGVPLVGREDDLEMLRLIARRAARERIPQLVTVIGEAGIGKTRLAGELFGELRSEGEEWRTVVGRSPPYGHGIAFWALGEILRDAAGTSTDARADQVEESLRGVLAELGAEDATELAAALTVAIRGTPDCEAEEDLNRAWRRFVSLLATERPLAIGVDDAHWADEGTLELLEDVAFGLHSSPILILCTSRPELMDRRPGFGRVARNITQLELLPLDQDSSRRLAELLLPQDQHEIAARIAEAAGGNPFFTEEVSRALGQEAADGTVSDRLPDTVQAAIAARIDQLSAEEKRALQYAAVLGHTFSQGPLGDLLGDSPGEALWGLRQKALVEERPGSESGHYVFRHQLIRDVAYNSLPRSERAQLHERAAEALLAREPFAELPELVAYHLTHACELESTPERGRAARDAVLRAAETAVRRGAAARGQELYEEAASLSDDAEAVDALEAAAEVALRAWRGDHALRLFREAGEAGERAGEPDRASGAYARAVEVGSRMHGISGDPPAADLEPMLRRGHELVADDDVVTRARLKVDEAWMAWLKEEVEKMDRPAQEGLELARQTADRQLLQNALDAVTGSDWLGGRQRSAVEHTRERLELLESAPQTHALDAERSDALHMMVLCLLQTGEFREAAAFALQGADIDRARGVDHAAFQRELMPCFFLGEWDRALELGADSRQAWIEAGRPPLGAFATPAACVGAIYGYRGEDAGAADWMQHAYNLVRTHTEQTSGVQMLEADVNLHHGRVEDALRRTEADLAGTQYQAPYTATRAEAFARAGHAGAAEAIELAERRVGEHRYAIGILLRAKGVHAGDEEQLRQSLELFEEIECPYQAARSGWLLGGDARSAAERTFADLGTPPPAD